MRRIKRAKQQLGFTLDMYIDAIRGDYHHMDKLPKSHYMKGYKDLVREVKEGKRIYKHEHGVHYILETSKIGKILTFAWTPESNRGKGNYLKVLEEESPLVISVMGDSLIKYTCKHSMVPVVIYFNNSSDIGVTVDYANPPKQYTPIENFNNLVLSSIQQIQEPWSIAFQLYVNSNLDRVKSLLNTYEEEARLYA